MAQSPQVSGDRFGMVDWGVIVEEEGCEGVIGDVFSLLALVLASCKSTLRCALAFKIALTSLHFDARWNHMLSTLPHNAVSDVQTRYQLVSMLGMYNHQYNSQWASNSSMVSTSSVHSVSSSWALCVTLAFLLTHEQHHASQLEWLFLNLWEPLKKYDQTQLWLAMVLLEVVRRSKERIFEAPLTYILNLFPSFHKSPG